MRRRSFLLASVSAAAAMAPRAAMTRELSPETRALLARFPFPYAPVSNGDALDVWAAANRTGVAVLVADERDIAELARPFDPEFYLNHRGERWADEPVLAEVSARADALEHPDALRALRASEIAARDARLVDNPELLAQLRSSAHSPVDAPLGAWPTERPRIMSFTPPQDFSTGQPTPLHMVRFETDDWTTIPAHLRYGSWNACPEAAYHVAAFRSWRDRFGARLAFAASSYLELQIDRPPTTRAAALDLAQELHWYCFDLVGQGYQTLSNLAAAAMESRWWTIWWD